MGMVEAPLPHPTIPPFSFTRQAGGARQVGAGKVQPRGQTGPRATNHTASPARPWVCLLGRQGAGVGTPSHLLQDWPLPGILRAGRVEPTLTVSHEAFLSPLPGQHPALAPCLGAGRRKWPPSALSSLQMLLGVCPLETKHSQSQEVIPRPLLGNRVGSREIKTEGNSGQLSLNFGGLDLQAKYIRFVRRRGFS